MLDFIKTQDFTVLMIYAEGCSYCEQMKPIFEQLELEFPLLSYHKEDISKITPFYERYADQKEMTLEDGTIVMVPKYIIPNFYIFARELQDETDEYGFAGGFDGANPEELRAVLNALQQKVLEG